jgi:Ca-activated chloride channel family protein
MPRIVRPAESAVPAASGRGLNGLNFSLLQICDPDLPLKSVELQVHGLGALSCSVYSLERKGTAMLNTKPLIALAFVSLVGTLGTLSASAGQVRLEVSLDKPTMQADRKQAAFVKVGLTGFKLDGKGKRAAVNVAIVLDKSGSMQGDKIAKAKEAAIAAIGRLGSDDIVAVVAYDSAVQVIVPATKMSDKESVIRRIRQIEAGGSTALFAGVSKGAEELRKFLDKNRVNRVILLSDGLANVGPQSPRELGALGAALLKEGISVSTMGLGLDYNEDLMTKLASNSGGNHVFIQQADNLVRVFNHEFNDVLSVVAQEVAVEIRLADGVRPVRVLNFDAEINGQQVIVQMNQVYSGQEKYLLLEVEVPATRAGKSCELALVRVSYANMQTRTTDRLTSAVSANFSESVAEVDSKLNAPVCAAAVLQISNAQNKLATTLRDQGDIEGARRVLLENSKYLGENALKYNAEILQTRCADNLDQAKNLAGPEWTRYRKAMREQQITDDRQQSYGASKP